MLLLSLHEECSDTEFFWSVLSRIRTKYGEILLIFPCSVWMLENMDQGNSEHGHFSCGVFFVICSIFLSFFFKMVCDSMIRLYSTITSVSQFFRCKTFYWRNLTNILNYCIVLYLKFFSVSYISLWRNWILRRAGITLKNFL